LKGLLELHIETIDLFVDSLQTSSDTVKQYLEDLSNPAMYWPAPRTP